jgi:tripartite-type tricarboxylate transporter receptor subunit TctC
LIHVPYRSEALALPDLLGGQVQVLFGVMPASLGYVRTGKLRALGVTTAKRSDDETALRRSGVRGVRGHQAGVTFHKFG